MDNNVIQKLLSDLNSKVDEIRPQLDKIREIFTLLDGIKKYTGASFELPDLSFLTSNNTQRETQPVASQEPKRLDIKPDTFYNKELTDAVESYLSMIGNATHLADIYEALKRGGASIDSKDRLNEALTRATRKFKKFGTGIDASFGILSWYGEKLKKKSLTREIIEKLEGAGIEDKGNKPGDASE